MAVAVGERLPKKYRSETLIMLVPQRIPDSYVKAADSDKLEDRLATLQDQILSRSRLERIILDLNLYRVAAARRCRWRTSCSACGRTSPCQRRRTRAARNRLVSDPYVSGDAQDGAENDRAAGVALHRGEPARSRERAEDTNQFLDSQLQDARRRLVEHEKKLEEYRRRYSGQLPSQASANLQAIQNAQIQLQSLREATDRARERRLLLERQLADLQQPDPTPARAAVRAGQAGPVVETTTQQLETARAQLRVLETRDKPTIPTC